METQPYKYIHFTVENGELKMFIPNIVQEQVVGKLENGELTITIE